MSYEKKIAALTIPAMEERVGWSVVDGFLHAKFGAEEIAAEADARLEVAQRLADALRRLLASHKDFMWCAQQVPPQAPDLKWSQEIEDETAAAYAEWEKQ